MLAPFSISLETGARSTTHFIDYGSYSPIPDPNLVPELPVTGKKVTKNRCCRSGSGIWYLLDPKILDPGWVRNQDPDPG